MSEPPDQTRETPIVSRGPVIFENILREVKGDLSRLTHHRRYHQDQDVQPVITAATGTVAVTITIPEAPMSFADIENEIKTLADHAKRIEHEVLPAAAGGLKQLEGLAGNPVVLSLLSAVHVPTEALAMAVKVIDGLEELYKPETAVAAPAVSAVPEVPAAPAEPAAAV